MGQHLSFDAGGIDGAGNTWDFSPKLDPTEAEVLAAVERCRTGRGVAEIEHDETPDRLPRMLLQADNGRYLLELRDGASEDSDVRSLHNPNPIPNPEAPMNADYIFGELFSMHEIVTDFDLVLQAFREFVRTGTVSTELMGYQY